MKRRRKHDSPISLLAFQDIITSVTGILILLTLFVTLSLITRQLCPPSVQSVAAAEDVTDVLDDVHREIEMLQSHVNMRHEELAELASLSPTATERELHDLREYVARIRSQISALQAKVNSATARRKEWESRKARTSEDEEILEQMQRELERLREKCRELRSQDRLIYNPQQGSGKTAWLVDIGSKKLVAARAERTESPHKFGSAREFLKWAMTRDPNQEYFVLLLRPSGIDSYEMVSSALREAHYDLGIDLIGEDQTVIAPKRGAGV